MVPWGCHAFHPRWWPPGPWILRSVRPLGAMCIRVGGRVADGKGSGGGFRPRWWPVGPWILWSERIDAADCGRVDGPALFILGGGPQGRGYRGGFGHSGRGTCKPINHMIPVTRIRSRAWNGRSEVWSVLRRARLHLFYRTKEPRSGGLSGGHDVEFPCDAIGVIKADKGRACECVVL